MYRYEFWQPEFVVSSVVIEHDEKGKGSITFRKRGGKESITDPVELSVGTLARIEGAVVALGFLDSTESYQSEKDYPHLGTSTFRLIRDGRRRTAVYNWTDRKEAKLLADEYRKIGNQYIWMFDIEVARENQPLESPRLLTALEMMVKRKDISDPRQLVPFLQGLSDDERIPLIARNHALKIVKMIEKMKN
jgi:hypothetical protein